MAAPTVSQERTGVSGRERRQAMQAPQKTVGQLPCFPLGYDTSKHLPSTQAPCTPAHANEDQYPRGLESYSAPLESVLSQDRVSH